MILNYTEAGKKVIERISEKCGDVTIASLPKETIRLGKEKVERVLEKYGTVPVKSLRTITFKDELRDAFPLYNDENDVDFLLRLLYFFPIEKVYISTGSYDQYLYDLEKTVIDNYESGNFQVSFFYAHLIFMSYVYYCVERAYQLEPDRMKDVFYPINAYNGRNDKPDLEHYNSIYDFSKIPEKEIFKVFRIMGMEHSQIRDLSKYISDRDDYAHATGKGNISEEELIYSVRNIRGYMDVLNSLFLSSVKEQYVQYLLERVDYECDSILESAADYIFDNNISIQEIEYLCGLGLRKIQDEKGLSKDIYLQLRKEHCAFIEFCIENYGIEAPEGLLGLRDENYLYYRYKNSAKDFVENELGISKYRCVKDGGEFPVYECPACGENQLVHNVEKGSFHCFGCDENYTDGDLTFCVQCGSIMRRTGDAPICQNCIENAMEK